MIWRSTAIWPRLPRCLIRRDDAPPTERSQPDGILKQPQYVPVSLTNQVVTILRRNGRCDGVLVAHEGRGSRATVHRRQYAGVL
jgi:hypothetical protein